MKRIIKMIASAAALIMAMSCTVFATDASITASAGTGLTVYAANGTVITAGSEGMYSDPEYYSLTYTNKAVAAGGQYIVLMVAANLSGETPVYDITEKSLVYINQTASTSGSITFEKVYPSTLTDSVILISGTDLDGPQIVATVDVDGIKGDVNGDDKVNAVDAQNILKYSAGLSAFDASQLSLANVNGDGQVNAVDAQWVLKYAAGLITEFPAN